MASVQYFLVLSILNALQLVLSFTSIFFDGDSSAVTLICQPLTAILVSRFLLDLQNCQKRRTKLGGTAALGSTSSTNDMSSTRGSLSFARFVGSIGESLEESESHSGGRTSHAEDTELRSFGSSDAEGAFDGHFILFRRRVCSTVQHTRDCPVGSVTGGRLYSGRRPSRLSRTRHESAVQELSWPGAGS
ncbi:uncharacterized protein BXZ73DRAFT_105537 [Epithele typhae]|uniref:uncharacterized protein n=1 Tax=Epithele typhae TaxID=378194 RepID=UPI0020085333|nr:uncharacterized protein BXZ73DRAFT_105537 [Epithele typhae]KAH9917375.1 hypothetical protein BXZ73DRAFT_105537 [Epithele typhae]